MFTINQNLIDDFADKINEKEKKSNKVTSLSSSSTHVEYPSAKTVYDELMTVRTVTPTINSGGSFTLNNVTKDWHETSHIIRPDFEHFEKIVYNITFEDNDFQMFFQQPSNSSGVYIIYFDGNDCYWGEADDNTGDLTQGSLICEGNTIQATVNKDNTITVGDTITNWDISSRIAMFGDVDFTYTVYSHKYLDTDFPYTFGDSNFSIASGGDYTVNSVTKDSGEIYLSSSTNWDNAIEKIYTITFNDDNFSYLDMNHGDNTIYFDGTDCYWGEWDENNNSVLNKGTLICEGNVVQATYLANNDGRTYFPDGNYLTDMDTANLNYFGDVNIKMRTKALVLEYANNKIHYLTDSFNDYICYPSIATLKDYAEDKSNKVTSWSNTTTDIHYPSERLVKDSLDGKANSTHNHTKSQITDFPTSMTPTSHTHGNLQNDGSVGTSNNASKNVVTDSNGKITTEAKPTIPTATSDLTNDSGFLTSHQDITGKEDKSNKVTSLSSSSTDTEYPSAKAVFNSLPSVPSASSITPSADTTNGSVGDGTTWARSNHTHPKSSLYAESTHTHEEYIQNQEFYFDGDDFVIISDESTITKTLIIVWNDNNDARGLRPRYLGATINDITAYLSEESEWSVSVPVDTEDSYEWSIPSVSGYTVNDIDNFHDITTFTLYRKTAPSETEEPEELE